jgi:TonB-linked SusC/RagA family outer membrane protein
MKNLNNLILQDHHPALKKFLLIMRLSIILCFMGMIQMSASVYSQNTKLTFSYNDLSVKDALNDIEKKTEFRFFYNEDYIDLSRKITLEGTDMNLEEVLSNLLRSSGANFKILENNLIIIAPNEMVQQQKITGIVTDKFGASLPGVNVMVTGTTQGTITDYVGKYSIEIPQGGKSLTFSFIGMESQEISIGTSIQINVTMVESATRLEEVVVVGYGTQKKINLTGSVAQVNSEELVKQAVTNAAQAIQGLVSGVEVVRNSGAPGAGATIRIRGLGTFGNTTPLILIDGIEGDLSLLSPQGIESINILKDASACAIYGTRAANGVVIVTTKTGQPGRGKIQYGFSTGINKGIRIPNALDARDFVRIQNEALINANVSSFYSDEQIASFGEGTNWIDEILQTGIRKNHNLQFSGGTEKIRYSLMGDLLDETGIVINSWYKRYNVRLNLDTDVTEWLKIGLNSFMSHSKKHDTPYISGSGENTLLMYALQYTPTISPKVGGMEGTGGPTHGAPTNAEWWTLDPVTYSNLLAKNRNYFPKYTLTSSFFADFKILESVHFKTTWGGTKYFAKNKVFYPSYTYYDSLGKEGGGSIVSERLPKNRQLTETSYDNFSYTITNLLTYTKTINDEHNLDILIGHNDQLYENKYFSATAYNFPSNELQMLSLGTERQSVSEYAEHWSLRSFFGRLNYNYRGKYLAEFSMRRDASSKFAEKYKWGTFPSGSIGWRISDESFMKQFGWIDDLKLRASYGVLGGQDVGNFSWNNDKMIQIDYDLSAEPSSIYESYATMDMSSSYPFNSTYTTGAAVTAYANPNLKWEVAHMTNLGLDLKLFNSNLVIDAEYFVKRTKDLFLPVSLPGTIGVGSTKSYQNVGEMINSGLEYSVHYFKRAGDFNFDIRYSGTHLKNEVLKLQPGIKYYYIDGYKAHGFKIGEPYGALFGYNVIGVYQTQEEIDERLATITERATVGPGDYIYEDVNGDKKINTDDLVVQGSPLPSYIFGLTANASYKGFDFNIHIQGDLGKSVATMVRGRFEFTYLMYLNNFDYILDRWRGPGTSNSISRVMSGNSSNNTPANEHFIQNASYAKIRNVELGYTIPANVTQKIGIQGLRVYCSVANLAYFTKYVGFEVEQTGSYQRADIYPQSRTISFGANVQF